MAGSRPSKVSDAQLLAVPHARNLRQLLLAIGVAGYGGNYEVVRARLAALGVDDSRFARRPRRPAPEVTPDRLEQVVRAADSYADVARQLRLGASSSAQRTAKRLVHGAGLDTSHFLGHAANRGARQGGREPERWETLLVAGRRVATSGLRKRLIAEGLLPPECAVCALEEWQGRPVPLELDHISGDRTDNRLENLRLLCPNCHAQTATYRGRNIGLQEGTPAEQADPHELPAEAARRRLAGLLLRAPVVP